MPARLITVAFIAATAASYSSAQSYGATGEVSTFSRSEQYGGEVYMITSKPELLGGPVRQPGEIRIASERSNDGFDRRIQMRSSATETTVIDDGSGAVIKVSYEDAGIALTDSYRASQSRSGGYVQPGTQVQTADGMPIGRVAIIEKADAGQVKKAWVRRPNTNSSDLQQVNIRSVTYRNGEFVAVAG